MTTRGRVCYTRRVMPLPAMSDIDAQIALLERGVADIVPRAELRAKLENSARAGRPLQIKLGLDPTAPDIHLGFAVVLRKLRQFQDLGHQVVIIIGDYTALIGDPSGRSSTRPMLSREAIDENARTYVEQLTRILDRDKTSVRFNSEWLGRLDFAELVQLSSRFTLAQIMQREDFSLRYSSGLPISLHELLYPLAQAYDSVAIRADVEMGGLDQTFNILAGRDLQRELGQEPQVALFMPLLVGLDGTKKMSKSLGNYVGVSEAAGEQFGKIMSLSDELMPTYFELCTDVRMDEVKTLTNTAQTHPRAAKKRLAREIVTIYHGAEAAQSADDDFERVHGKSHSADAVPDDTPDVPVPPELAEPDGRVRLTALLPALGLAASGADARRLISQGGVSVDGEKISDVGASLLTQTGQVIRVGKARFARLIAPAGG